MLLLAGCSRSVNLESPDLVQVNGTVTYKGTPVPGARVAFHPAKSNAGNEIALAEADSNGRFVLKTHEYGPGAEPGDYVVTVTHLSGGIPNKYKSEDSTPLTVTVEDKESNEILLNLED